MTVWQITSDFDTEYYSLDSEGRFVPAAKPVLERTEGGRRYRIVGDRTAAWWASEMSVSKLFWYVNSKRPEVILAGCRPEPGQVEPAPVSFVPSKPRADEWNKKFGVFQVRQYAGPVVRTVTLTPIWTYEAAGAVLDVEWNLIVGMSPLRPLLGRDTEPLLTPPNQQWKYNKRQMTFIGLADLTERWVDLVNQEVLCFDRQGEHVDVPVDRTSMNFDPDRLGTFSRELMEYNTTAMLAMHEAWTAYCRTVEAVYGSSVNVGWVHDLQKGWVEGAMARGQFPATAGTVQTVAGMVARNVASHVITVDPVTGEFGVNCRRDIPRQVLADYELARFKEEMTGVDVLGPYIRARSKELCDGDD